jgi:hypothetical protein
MIAIPVLCLLAILLTGCTMGQPNFNTDELIKLMQAPNASGCLTLDGVYPPFATGQLHMAWGAEPPGACDEGRR